MIKIKKWARLRMDYNKRINNKVINVKRERGWVRVLDYIRREPRGREVE